MLPGSFVPSVEELNHALEIKTVSFGLDESAIASLCSDYEEDNPTEPLILLAQGFPATPSQEAELNFSGEYEIRAGLVLPDGSINYKERNFYPHVEKDELLATFRPPIKGHPGKTVLDEEIPDANPTGIDLVAGENVRVDVQEDGSWQLYADLEGGAIAEAKETRSQVEHMTRYTLSVRPSVLIAGDVGYETGNIDFVGNVEIRGSIISGFIVAVTGDLAVSGSIENDSDVKAGGGITVRQGIVGTKTRVKAGGSVVSKYVQSAHVQAGGDVVIGSYIHDANIRSEGWIRVGGRGGGIVGGNAWALLGIASPNVGSERSTTTNLTAGLDSSLFGRFESAAQTAGQADAFLAAILKNLGLSELSADEIRRVITGHPGRKKVILHYLKKANQLALVQARHLEERDTFQSQIMESAKRATIDVTDVAYARTTLRIGTLQTQLPNDLKHVRFSIDSSDRQSKVHWGDLSG
jgi:hypothetical protein